MSSQLTYGTTNQDDTSKESWLINGQTPGPHPVWDEGDTIIANVTNNGPEPMTMHWHGKPTPFNHISNDTAVLTKLKNAELNAHLLNVYDYKHSTSEHWMAEWERTDVEQLCIDNIVNTFHSSGKGQVMCPSMTLINPLTIPEQKPLTKKGCMYPNSTLMFLYPDSQLDTVSPAMRYNCTNSSTPFQVFTVNQSDGWIAFNLLNVHSVAADGHYTNIQVANSVIILIGEHCQFFVKLNQTAGDYLIRTSAVVLPQLIAGYAIMSYITPKADPTKLPTSKNPIMGRLCNIINGGVDLVMCKLSPYPALLPPQGPADRTLNLNATRTEEFGWVLNGNKWHELPNDTIPLLFNPSVISELDPKVYMSYENGTLVDVIFTVTAGNPATVNNGFKGINLQNPPYRDDFVTPVALTGQAWTVMRFRSVDPGHPWCTVISMSTLQLAWWSVCHNFSRVNVLRCTYSMVGLVMLEGAEQLVPGYVPNYYVNQNKP
ncbi:hypothetical protein FRC10_011337 [Ceratobasidium sp. 414]|nr:hypothetical protein FRC10_011337 [Ceratobasidium sp. 414]